MDKPERDFAMQSRVSWEALSKKPKVDKDLLEALETHHARLNIHDDRLIGLSNRAILLDSRLSALETATQQSERSFAPTTGTAPPPSSWSSVQQWDVLAENQQDALMQSVSAVISDCFSSFHRISPHMEYHWTSGRSLQVTLSWPTGFGEITAGGHGAADPDVQQDALSGQIQDEGSNVHADVPDGVGPEHRWQDVETYVCLTCHLPCTVHQSLAQYTWEVCELAHGHFGDCVVKRSDCCESRVTPANVRCPIADSEAREEQR